MTDTTPFDTVVDTVVDTTPASSPTSSSSDSDAVNTASARVYFGPLQSPEKKLLHQITHPNVSGRSTLNPAAISSGSYSCRSVIFPSSTIASRDENSDANDESEDGGEDVSQSRSGTPDNVRFPQDEPSSVLASRIIRAQDNPSPPPRARHIPSSAPSPLKDSLFPSRDYSGSPEDDVPNNTDIAIKYSSMFDRPASPSPEPSNGFPGSPSLTLGEASFSSLPEPLNNTPQHQLISFESFSTHSASPGRHDFAAAGPSRQPQIVTAVNYLSPSPRRAVSPIRLEYDLTADTMRPRSTSPTRRSARLTLASESPSLDEQIPSLYERPSRPEPISPSLFPPVVAPVPQSDQPQTPRRSPRRSVTPQSLKPLPASPPPPVPPLPPVIATSSSFQTNFETPPAMRLLAEPSSGAQIRKNRWKARAGDEVVDNSQEERSRSGSAAENMKVETRMEQLEEEEEMKRGQEHGKEKDDRTQRELGSLSPGSANVLAQLYPSTQATTMPNDIPFNAEEPPEDAAQDAPPESNVSIFPAQLNTLTSVQRPPPGSPVRFASPLGGRSSPNKLIPTLDLNDPTRTPARRIPIRQAIAHGTASAQKFGQMNSHLRPNDSMLSLRSPVFTRPALDHPLRSPARRIPISEVLSSAKKATRHGSRSPMRGVSRERSGSAELGPQNGRDMDRSIEQQRPMDLPTSSTSFRPVSKLPFPIVTPQPPGHDRATVIPEESEALLSPGAAIPHKNPKPAVPAITSAEKSSLKQSSSSRIPRIGIKPYVRPTTSVKEKVSRLSTTTGKVRVIGAGPTKSSKPTRMVGSGSGSGCSSSDDINTGPSSSIRTKSGKDTPVSTNLKRKRGLEKTSPSQPRPIVLIRQVVPGMLGPKYAPTTPPTILPSPENLVSHQVEASAVKKSQRPITIRRVGDNLSENVARDRVEVEANAANIVDEEIRGATKKDQDDTLIIVAKKSSQPTMEYVPQSSPMPSQNSTDNTVPDHSTFNTSPPEDDTEPLIKVRRTTRPRKQTPLNDVFTAPRPLQPRRKAPNSNRSDADAFSGLSSVALKALTSSNTTRNQQNFVSLATEVIRKDGRRPESPMMKVRTISQREAEERAKGRSERAHRRARRSDDGMSDTDGFSSDRGDSIIVEGEGEWDEDEPEQVRLHKHRRGPGDEEDYETPAKRTSKRPRSREDAEQSQEEIQEKKRVKWDRGLYSEIYLDDIEVKPKKHPKEDIVKKGCLAPTAKALRLDTLGNIINADLPLTDLVHENIIVKKFVYDNDVEPDVPAVKSTRSRSKKAKC